MIYQNGDMRVFECGCIFRFASYFLNEPRVEGWTLQGNPMCDPHIEFYARMRAGK